MVFLADSSLVSIILCETSAFVLAQSVAAWLLKSSGGHTVGTLGWLHAGGTGAVANSSINPESGATSTLCHIGLDERQIIGIV